MGTADSPRGGVLDRLTVPVAEADAVRSALNQLIGLVDELVRNRQGGRTSHLAAWEGAARMAWDEAFAYSQADGQAVIDELQALGGEVTEVIGAIEDHNVVVAFLNR